MHYIDWGRRGAPVLIAVHGFGASAHAWEPLADLVSEDYRIVALDLPGHGLTETPHEYRSSLAGQVRLIDEAADQLELSRFALIGHSMGAQVALRYAMTGAREPAALVLISPAGGVQRDGAGDRPAWASGFWARLALRSVDPRPFVENGLRRAYDDPARVTDALIDRYVDFATARGRLRTLLSHDPRPDPVATPSDFDAIGAPTLVIAGGRDRIVSPQDAEDIAGVIAGASLRLLGEAGHMPMEEFPETVAAELREMLDAAGDR
ncbi:MAG: alpha/beta fold hydrolase [Pseudomonadota bacterium]